MSDSINPRTELVGISRRLLRAKDGDTEKAEAAVMQYLDGDPALAKRLLRTMVGEAVKSVVQATMRSDRSIAARKAVPRSPTTIRTTPMGRILPTPAERVAAQSRAAAESFFASYPLACGVKLKNATRSHVEKQFHIHETQGSTHQKRARWLRAVLDIMPDDPDATVAEYVGAEETHRLFLETDCLSKECLDGDAA